MRRLFALFVLLALAGCARNPIKIWEQLEKSVEPHYRMYFEGKPKEQFAAMQEVERLTQEVNPAMWKAMDQGTYEAWIYGRAALAAERAGLEEEARKYRTKAVWQYRRHKTWNYAYQKMLPVTPTPSAEDAERELFAGIAAMDEVIRKEGFRPEKAKPDARANADICHASCWRTSRASCHRGSSITFGKEEHATRLDRKDVSGVAGLAPRFARVRELPHRRTEARHSRHEARRLRHAPSDQGEVRRDAHWTTRSVRSLRRRSGSPECIVRKSRTRRQSQRAYGACFSGVASPLHIASISKEFAVRSRAWLTFNVRCPHTNEARSRFFVYSEPGVLTCFRKSCPAARREEEERAFWFSRIDWRGSCHQLSTDEDWHRSGACLARFPRAASPPVIIRISKEPRPRSRAWLICNISQKYKTICKH
jgi:hypothetical protein